MARTAKSPQARSGAELVVERIRLRLARALGEKVRAADLAAVERRLAGAEGAHRARLHALFSLAEAEKDCLDCAVAVAVEPALGPVFATLQGQPGRFLPTEVALRLLFAHGPEPILRPTSALIAWGMVERVPGRPGEPDMIEADEEIVEWFFGRLTPDLLSGVALAKAEAPRPLDEWQIEAQAARLRRILAARQCVRVTIPGLPGSGRSSFAAAIVEALGVKAVLAEPAAGAPDFRSTFQRLQRTALLGDLALIWQGDPGSWPTDVPVAPLQFVTVEPGQVPARRRGLVDVVLPMPALSRESLERLTAEYLPRLAGDVLSPLGSPRIVDLSDAAAQQMRTAEEFRAMLRERTRERTRGIGRLADLAYDWNDLVLPPRTRDLLESIEQEARLRHALLKQPEKERLFGAAALLTVMMSGPPGTGKSMSGQVLANALGLDLMLIDMGATVSKFVGETAKNLTAAFRAARDANCAIMFEEADSLFARRTDADSVNARHANADTGHLLQLIEGHDGLVMLSTNRRANIDTAFLRRMRFIVEFPMPGREERNRLWEKLLAPLGVAARARAAMAEALAEAHELSPAQIKAAALSGAYLAEASGKPIALGHLTEGVMREFLKEGRLAKVSAPVAALPRRRAHA
ncbi:ATP-binding protein [Sphingosinicella terrae]|uniref:ATP-binding protein n=1 Tax=Sphingosinicella terrae TaxID=2172047 RepID=UPI000E0D20FB|nr:ATP-binding protein [Sphingosinicella terrae]